MRVIIAGGRDFNNAELLLRKCSHILSRVDVFTEPSEVVCGEAPGADALGKVFARQNGYGITSFEAQWDRYGKAAGPLRNREMARHTAMVIRRACICFWDGQSRGTANMIELCKEFLIPLEIVGYRRVGYPQKDGSIYWYCEYDSLLTIELNNTYRIR